MSANSLNPTNRERPNDRAHSTPRVAGKAFQPVCGNVIEWSQSASDNVHAAVPIPGEDGTQTISGPTAYACVALGLVGAALAFAGQWVGAL